MGGYQPLSYLCQNEIIVFANSAIVFYYLPYGRNGGVEESQIEVGVVHMYDIVQITRKHKENLVRLVISSNLKGGSEDVVTTE